VTEIERICNALRIVIPNSDSFNELQSNWVKETNFNEGHPLVKDVANSLDVDSKYVHSKKLILVFILFRKNF